MKVIKFVSFYVHGKEVEKIEADDIDLRLVDNIKTSVAIMHGVSYDSVDVITKDEYVLEKSTVCQVNPDGKLVFKANSQATFVEVGGLSPSMDISKEDFFLEFLDLIQKKDFDNALIFRKQEIIW